MRLTQLILLLGFLSVTVFASSSELSSSSAPTESSSGACGVECTWTCTEPVCSGITRPKCNDLTNCTITNCTTGTGDDCSEPDCKPTCPADSGCPSYGCPMCEAECDPLTCTTSVDCTIECDEIECYWESYGDAFCALPECVLECETPSCNTTTSSGVVIAASLIAFIF